MSAFEINVSGDVLTLILKGEVTIEHVAALHSALVRPLSLPKVLAVDASHLTRLDAAALQVLLAAARSAGSTRLISCSAAWTAAIKRHAVQDPFAQP